MMFISTVFLLCLLSMHVQVSVQPPRGCPFAFGCLICLPPYHCTSCERGFYKMREGQYNQCRACPPRCAECERRSNCTVCSVKNHYGRYCRSVCSKGCLSSTCDQLSGTCPCKDNYVGSHCEYCKNGKYGFNSNCSMDCPVNCKTCISNKNCTECKDGYYGNTCEISCSGGCYLGKCSQVNGTCYQNKCKPNFNGINCDQCFRGRFGKYCQSACPKNCVSCSSKAACDKCRDGFWGDTCQNNCSPGCLGGICIKTSGVCQVNTCRTGFAGEKCDRCTPGKQGFNCNVNKTGMTI